jgi:transposase, IS30 family
MLNFVQQRICSCATRSRNAITITQMTWHRVEHYFLFDQSPEQISDKLDISHESIYRYIYRDKKAGGCWHRYLRCQKPYRKRCSGSNRRGFIANQVRIDERPAHIEDRAQIGHCEFDTVVGPFHGSRLLTGVERKSGFAVAALLADGSAESAWQAMIRLLTPFTGRVKTVTTDYGKEFARHQELDAELGCTSYFSRPYASCERGSNENTNGLIRQYLPKKRDLATVTQDELDIIMDRLNNRPRKRLQFKTPNQVFLQSLKRFASRR